MINKTRDIEAKAFRAMLSRIDFSTVIELGCGTGKNTEWLARQARQVIAVDFSEQMLEVAKKKLNPANVEFIKTDITKPWSFFDKKADLITCSLILEHIADLDFIFKQASIQLRKNGFLYIGELHPFKQYEGSKARFETATGILALECFTHHFSDYTHAATNSGFSCHELEEWFDDDNKSSAPRIVAFIFQKK